MRTYRYRKTKRLKPKFYLPIILTVLLLAGLIGYDQYQNYQITSLGYNSKIIRNLKKQKIRGKVIKLQQYAPALEQALLDNSYQADYFALYYTKQVITSADLHLYNRLTRLKNYPNAELLTTFSELDYREIVPLLVFDDSLSLLDYRADVVKNREKNQHQFVLDTDYLKSYQNFTETDLSFHELMLVNSKNKLPDNYQVENLTNIPISYRLAEMELIDEAKQAFVKLCQAMENLGFKIASTSAYRSLASQQAIYQTLVNQHGQLEAEKLVIRPGFSEHQTGYAVDVASLTEPNKGFALTKEASWLADNSYKYGFILRYPRGYESITGIEYESWHFRYVGISEAEKIYQSGLTFDEYYYLYLAPLPTLIP